MVDAYLLRSPDHRTRTEAVYRLIQSQIVDEPADDVGCAGKVFHFVDGGRLHYQIPPAAIDVYGAMTSRSTIIDMTSLRSQLSLL